MGVLSAARRPVIRCVSAYHCVLVEASDEDQAARSDGSLWC